MKNHWLRRREEYREEFLKLLFKPSIFRFRGKFQEAKAKTHGGRMYWFSPNGENRGNVPSITDVFQEADNVTSE